eukprot:TRINITY_DN6465_c0_g1_i1.p1 TRINITY_DN6465_c0_g1~~TRINITY_DN6465_c0_g1_i1.p1  ORF type:complete len:928 (-),score=199.10 TRINITY_DN6465_c0_g1_i1:89-2872(-)
MATLSFTILGTGDDQMDPALVVHWKHHRVLFNCVEGIKRLSFEYKLHLAGKLRDIFITRANEWSPAGGTTELLMGLDEVLAKEKEPHLVGIHGPSPIVDFLHATQPFFWRPELSVKIFQFSTPFNASPYDIDELSVQPITFCINDPSKNNTDNNGSDGNYPLRRLLAVDFSQYRQQPAHLYQPQFPQLVTCYILTTPPLPGKFDVVKANVLGVPKGPLFGRLVKGEEITLADGKKISPSDCVGPATPGPVIIVLDCASEFVCQSILDNALFKPYFASSQQQQLSVVYLSIPEDVITSKAFGELVSAFGNHAVHLFAKEPPKEDQHQLYLGSEAFQAKLHIMAPEFWPLAYQQRRQLKNGPSRRSRADSNTKKRQAEGDGGKSSNDQKRSKSADKTPAAAQGKKNNKSAASAESKDNRASDNEALELLFSGTLGTAHWWKGKKIHVAKPLMSYVLLPLSSAGLDMSKADLECPTLDEIKAELPSEVISMIDSDATKMSSIDATSYHIEPINDNVRISFLGTIAAQVSKYRSVSSIFVELPRAPSASHSSRVKYMLLDTGDGSLAQLVRLRGRKEVERILEDLSVIFISHKHGDHMIGITKLLSKISELKQKRSLRRRSLNNASSSEQMEELGSSASSLTLEDKQLQPQPHHHHPPHHVCHLCKASFSSPTSVELHSFLHQPFGTIIETNPNPEDPALHYAVSKLSSSGHNDEQPLLIIGPMWLQVWLQDFHKIEPRISYVFADAELLSKPEHALQPWLVSNMGIELQTVRVIHSFPSYAVIIKHLLSNKKFAYSGDTRPCPDLVAAGRDLDLLIHEATHFDDMIDKALSDRHSTLSEAVDISVQMKAKVTILTHFSGRFETAPPDIERFQQQNEHLIAAYDFLSVELNDELPALAKRFIPDILPRLRIAFPVAEDEYKKHKHPNGPPQ